MASRKRFLNANGPPAFVLHTSVALTWVVRDLNNTYSSDVLNALIRTNTIVPQSWLVDLAGEVSAFEMRNWYSSIRVNSHFAVLETYPILVDDQINTHAWGVILSLARTHLISVQNAAYLELALRLDLPLATTDAALTRSAGSAGIPIYTP